jgi:hypothetical protein
MGKREIRARVPDISQFLIVVDALLKKEVRLDHFGHEGDYAFILDQVKPNNE